VTKPALGPANEINQVIHERIVKLAQTRERPFERKP
jgi:hypothetical protein